MVRVFGSLLFIGFAVSWLVGCGANVAVNRTTEAYETPLNDKGPQCGIPILRAVHPEQRFAIVARLSLSDNTGLFGTSRGKAEQQLLDSACGVGADAVLIEREHYAMPYVGTDVVALAIAYTDEPASKPKARPKVPDKTFGTCFAVSGDGKLATAAHVVRAARSVSVQFEGSDPIKAAVWARDEETDIAILDIDEETPNHLVLAEASVATSGDRVFTFGFPVVDFLGQEPKFTDGAVSSLSGLKGEKRLMQITVPIQPGNSGGPVVTEGGLVIGIITSTVATTAFFEATGSLPQGINWAVKAEHARVLLEAAPAEHKKLKRKAAVRLVRKSVCAVIVENQKHTND